MSDNHAPVERLETYAALLSDRVRRIRKSLDLTQEAMAKQTGYTRGHISAMETGKRNVSIQYLNTIGIVFQIPLNKLLEGVPNTKIEQMKFVAYAEMAMKSFDENDFSHLNEIIRYVWNLKYPNEDFEKTMLEMK